MNQKGSIAKILLGVSCFTFAAALGTAFLIFHGTPNGDVKQIVIPRGSSIRSVAQLLAEQDIIRRPQLFKNLLRFTGGASKVRAGEYQFQTGMSLKDALSVLYQAEPLTHAFTIPEGWNARMIALGLEQAGLADERRFLDLALSASLAQKYGLLTPHLEGFLYPDTYHFSRVEGEERIVDAMVQRFFQEYAKIEPAARATGMSREQIVTLASIVEKETGVPEERPLIASVFLNRLKKGMRLQSDPTTIYGVLNFDGNLTKAHLQERTAYNTYAISGLPPGPIASPGGDALRAVIAPAKSEFIYFVANNHGTHLFSKTYKEHLERVGRYHPKIVRKTQGKR